MGQTKLDLNARFGEFHFHSDTKSYKLASHIYLIISLHLPNPNPNPLFIIETMKVSALSIASVGIAVALQAAPANAQQVRRKLGDSVLTSSPTSDTLPSAKSAKAAALFPKSDKAFSTSSPTSDTLTSAKSAKAAALFPKLDKADDTCTPPLSGNTCETTTWPTATRQKQLSKFNDIEIISEETYTETFDDETYRNRYLHQGGSIVPDDNRLGTLIIDGSELECQYDVQAIAASKCEELDCDYYLITGESLLTTRYTLDFYEKGSVTSQTLLLPFAFPWTFGVGFFQQDIVLRKSKDIVLPPFPGCDVPSPNDLPLAFECALAGDDCDGLVTADFIQYVLPSAECLLGLVPDVFGCLTCINNAFDSNSCPTDDVCEPNSDLNLISATPCGEGEAEGTNDCVCNACGDVCGGSACTADIQMATLCQLGAYLNPNPNPNPVLFGGCQNANLEGRDPILQNNFTCDFVE